VAVFGDDWQDEGMLRTFANSVAMGNAHDRLKSLARHVTRSNDQDGVAWALHHLLRLV
jgi:hydroxymethylpyrimidine pyrophosphatase-like HAD family hydrolase